ncbi:expressed unknown protein [Seminavis robusta]|uniref:Ricin B lectin domain-containing protein n=1 Tax=Seminavis robusta TaxID=568900 RepID=A0A9N8DW81_9STRA|nr:expressed unknown protein [Seminavis robusta]|eukprot:Sro398_g134650.1 n/a (260) ;mRNA; f:22119-22898
MTRRLHQHESLFLLTAFVILSAVTTATHPHGWNPSISLTDDSREPLENGFCPDIAGFGSGLNCARMQAHSCKPEGSDTQFGYDPVTKAIYSVTYTADCNAVSGEERGACVTVQDNEIVAGASFGLAACDNDNAAQQFTWTTNGQFQIWSAADNVLYCLAVGSDVREAGRYYAADLILADCDATDLVLTQWTVDNQEGFAAEEEEEEVSGNQEEESEDIDDDDIMGGQILVNCSMHNATHSNTNMTNSSSILCNNMTTMV